MLLYQSCQMAFVKKSPLLGGFFECCPMINGIYCSIQPEIPLVTGKTQSELFAEKCSKGTESPRTGGKEKVDYRNVLSESDFEKFRILRECRKILAEEEAVPPYAVFLDEHLATIAQKAEINEAALKSVNGVGEKKIEKYSKRFLELWNEKINEKSGQSVLENRGN